MPLVSEILTTERRVSDSDLRTTCPICQRETRLDLALLDDRDPLETIYGCPSDGCDGIVLIVSTPGVVPWEGRGYRLGEWMIRNPGDLYMQTPEMPSAVLMNASPHALD